MNKNLSAKNIAVSVLSFILLTGFSGKQRFIELRGVMNGRSSADFDADSNNKVASLDNRTRAEVLERKKLDSGNYGLRIKPLTGPNKGKEVWVFYDMHEPEMRLFDEVPADWSKNSARAGKPTNDVDAAVAAEMNRDVKGLTEDSPDDKALIEMFDRANSKISQVGRPAGNCPTCEAKAAQQAGRGEQVNNTHADSNSSPPPNGSYAATTNIAWESTPKSESEKYNAYIREAVAQIGTNLLDLSSVSDIEKFCPNYRNLKTKDKKLDFWALVFSQISPHESSNDPGSTMIESYKDKDRDKVTGQYARSSGLMQISYENQSHGKECHFDWKGHDEFLKPEDTNRSIFNIRRNLRCAVLIMSHQIKNAGGIVIDNKSRSRYWSVILENNPKQKISTIRGGVAKSPLCRL